MNTFALLIPVTTSAPITRHELRTLLATSQERRWRIVMPGLPGDRAPHRSMSVAAAWRTIAERGLDIRSIDRLPAVGQYTPPRWRVEIGQPLPAPDEAWI